MNFKEKCFVLAIALASSPAFAQFQKAQATMNSVQTGLYSLAAVAVTISLMWVGFKMVFQSAHFKDLAHIFWGGIVIGSSTALAGMFLN